MQPGILTQHCSVWYVSAFQMSSASGTETFTDKVRQVEVGQGLLGKTFQN